MLAILPSLTQFGPQSHNPTPPQYSCTFKNFNYGERQGVQDCRPSWEGLGYRLRVEVSSSGKALNKAVIHLIIF